MTFLIPLLTLLLANAKSFFRDTASALTEQVVLRIRGLLQILVILLISTVLTCVGVSLSIVNGADQLDKNGTVEWTPSLILFLSLTAVAVGGLLWSLRRRTWQTASALEEKAQAPRESKSSPIETALAVLIMDFVEERQRRRTDSAESSAAEAAEPSSQDSSETSSSR